MSINNNKFLEEIIMNIVKYDPFRELRSLQDEMNRLFSSSTFPAVAATTKIMRTAHGARRWIFTKTKIKLVLEAELPGMKPRRR